MLVSIAEEMNPTRRNTQEDAHVVHGPGTWGAPNDHATFIGVMDGHGGPRRARCTGYGTSYMYVAETTKIEPLIAHAQTQ